MEVGLTIEPGSVRSLSTGGTNLTIPSKLEAGTLTVSPPSGGGGQKTSLINKIAAQLANSKASNTPTTLNIAIAPAPLSNGKDPKSKNPIVATMTEALSLKQSPTLTKQLSKPTRGSGAGVQVITQYMCRYCGQQFESTDDMQRHIQEHVTGKAPHECSVCGKTYRTPSKLQRHVRVHSGERPYACSICGRRFTRSDHVKQHMKVHCQPKDANVCHLCNDMKFSRRQALHLHLQQQHVMQQVFTCHRCGEAYESLEEMQTHKLTHDSVLNSLKDGASIPTSGTAIAKFALGQQKNEQGMNKYDTIKPELTTEDTKQGVVLKVPNNNGFYIPANMDNVSALSNKLIMEGMEKMAAEMEVQRKYQEELTQLNADTRKYLASLEEEKQMEEERVKIAECFTIKASTSNLASSKSPSATDNGDGDTHMDIVAGKETTTIVNGDGMSMFILPTTFPTSNGDVEKSESEMEADDTESEQNSSKDSVAINREGDGEKSEGDVSDKMDTSGESGKLDDSIGDKSTDEAASEGKISKLKPDGYSKPCPKSKKPGYVPPSSQTSETKTVSSEDYVGLAPKPLLSILNPRINELIKAKVEQNMNQTQNQTTYLVAPPTLNMSQQQMPKLTFIPSLSGSKFATMTSLPTLLPAPGVSSIAYTSTAPILSQPMSIKSKTDASPKLIKCDHCCIYFEDNAMSMLHNTLHSADSMDPFTCRKCYKKLGNRLEFMAHMVWHLEPNMDI